MVSQPSALYGDNDQVRAAASRPFQPMPPAGVNGIADVGQAHSPRCSVREADRKSCGFQLSHQALIRSAT